MTINVGGAEQALIETQDKRIESLQAQVAALEAALKRLAGEGGPWDFVDMNMETTTVANMQSFARAALKQEDNT